MCDSCHFVDEKMSFLRERDAEARLPDARRRAHGPVRDSPAPRAHDRPRRVAVRVPRLHRRSKTDRPATSTAAQEAWRQAAAERFERLSPKKEECGDCSFIPVCGGGCSVAAHTELGDMHQPSCHKGAFESAVVSLAERTAAAIA